MKHFNILVAAFLVFNMALSQTNSTKSDYSVYGESFSPEETITLEKTAMAYQNLQIGDSVNIAFEARVNGVCQAKGCWMTLQLGEEKEVLVKFKDYGFFVPTDLDSGPVIVKGTAFVEGLSVEEQRHYAQDAGKTPSEVANITQPKRTLRFEATGVLIEN